MKKELFLGACLAVLCFGCQQDSSKPSAGSTNGQMKKSQPTNDQNYQDRRRDMKSRANGGCCGGERMEAPKGQTTANAEVSVEKAK